MAKDLDTEMNKKGRNFFVLIDNCTSYGTKKTLNSKLSSGFHPMDQGIVNSLKRSYRIGVLTHVLLNIEKEKCPAINIKMA